MLKLDRREFLKSMVALGIVATLDSWKGIEAYINPERKSFFIRNKSSQIVPSQAFVTLGEQLRISKKGIYQLSARVVFEPNLEGSRRLQIMKGDEVLAMRQQMAEARIPKGLPVNELGVSCLFEATEEELKTVQVQVYQNSGQNLKLNESRIGGWRIE